MRRRQTVLVALLLAVAPLKLSAADTARPWQDGELLSRKTVPVGRSFLQNRFVYRLHGYNCSYMVVSDTALHLDLHVPMKFLTGRNQVVIQDADGQMRKLRILQKETTSRRR